MKNNFEAENEEIKCEMSSENTRVNGKPSYFVAIINKFKKTEVKEWNLQ